MTTPESLEQLQERLAESLKDLDLFKKLNWGGATNQTVMNIRRLGRKIADLTIPTEDDPGDALDLLDPESNLEPSQAAAELGRKGGKSKSPAKQEAAKKNGKKGGRPKRKTD